MVVGAVVLGTASLGLVRQVSPTPGEVRAGARPPAPALASTGLVIGGPSDVAIQLATYEPGQRSGWHTHTGLHAVVVMSGTLTIYDGDCHPAKLGPGDTYVGGQDVHLAVNEDVIPAHLAVTYMYPAGRSHTEFNVGFAAPPTCPLS